MDPPAGLDADQRAAWLRDRDFLAQLTDSSRVAPYALPIEVSGELRAYQREGVAWLAFLRRCGLHGVLADDMGLGKTLQASASIAGARAAPAAASHPACTASAMVFSGSLRMPGTRLRGP